MKTYVVMLYGRDGWQPIAEYPTLAEAQSSPFVREDAKIEEWNYADLEEGAESNWPC